MLNAWLLPCHVPALHSSKIQFRIQAGTSETSGAIGQGNFLACGYLTAVAESSFATLAAAPAVPRDIGLHRNLGTCGINGRAGGRLD